jgi:hypothetical protein
VYEYLSLYCVSKKTLSSTKEIGLSESLVVLPRGSQLEWL